MTVDSCRMTVVSGLLSVVCWQFKNTKHKNMSLEQNVMAQMKDAMKAKDEAGLRGLRAIKAAIINAKTAEGAHGELKEEEEVNFCRN